MERERDEMLNRFSDIWSWTDDYDAEHPDGTPPPEKVAEDVGDTVQRLRSERGRLVEAVERLGSMEAFEMARAVDDTPADRELIARIEYAREALEAVEGDGVEDDCTCVEYPHPRPRPTAKVRRSDCPVHGEAGGEYEGPLTKNTPWTLGWISRAGGYGVGADPYEYGSPESQEWRKGWTDADQTHNQEGETPHRVPDPHEWPEDSAAPQDASAEDEEEQWAEMAARARRSWTRENPYNEEDGNMSATPQDADAEGGQSEADVVLDLYPQTEDARGETAHADDALIRAAIRRARKSSQALGRDALAAYERLLTFKRRAARRLRRGGGAEVSDALDVLADYVTQRGGAFIEDTLYYEPEGRVTYDKACDALGTIRDRLRDAPSEEGGFVENDEWSYCPACGAIREHVGGHYERCPRRSEERPGGSGERGPLDGGYGTLTHASAVCRAANEHGIANALLDLRDRLRRSTPDGEGEGGVTMCECKEPLEPLELGNECCLRCGGQMPEHDHPIPNGEDDDS